MNRVLGYVGAIALLLALGFAAGWHAHGVSGKAAETISAERALSNLATKSNALARSTTERLQRDQQRTDALNAAQGIIRTASVDIRLEIDHATLLPEPVAGTPPDCPRPLDSPDFLRLYQRAAAGGSGS